ncbi:MAG: alpha/beta hydrolase [Bacteroidales bacterium]|nr:alpha/beta hydrolase [Bacteroidales bacterium]
MKNILSGLSALLALSIAFSASSCGSSNAVNEYKSYTATAHVNSVGLFYAAEGEGKPVILLHGNGGSHNDLETTQRELAQAGYMVYALDSRGQGANPRLPEYHYKDMASDVYEFIRLEGLEKPAVFGFSDGGNIALQLEVMYPGTLGAIVTGGANIFVEGSLVPDFERELLAEPSTEPLVIMLQTEPNMTVEDIKTIKCPALIMSGEHDLILADHTRLIGENIPNGEARIIPGEDHGSYICNSPKLTPLILGFFDEIGY